MIQMTSTEVAQLLHTPEDTISPSISFTGISIDTRSLQAGNLFVAIKGSNLNGHDFIEEAQKKGAAFALVDHAHPSSLPQIKVTDTTLALGQIGAAWRNRFQLPIVAITGSNGKTTLKNMIATIMVAACNGDQEKVLATKGTLNNQWGLPLTIANLNQQHRFAAIELGMNHFGEIEYLARLTRPKVAVITNAAASHLEGVGDIAGVAKAKGEIFSGLSQDGIAILNRDDAYFTFWREIVGKRPFITFGFHPDAHVRAVMTHSDRLNEIPQKQSFTIKTSKGDISIRLPLLGKHSILNALAATAATLAVDISIDAIQKGLENISPAQGRLQLHTLKQGLHLIDDTYNANPFSLQAAVNTLASFTGKKILVLGDMKELGKDAPSLHQTAGESIREAGIDFLFTYGELSVNATKAFGEGAYHFNNQDTLLDALKPFIDKQETVETITILIKGSRSMHMEKVVAQLVSYAY